jgi:two-component system, cell cycle response regulator
MAAASPALPPPSRPLVLVVDDEPQVPLAIADQLRRRFRVVPASSGKEALRLLDEQDFDVILSDQRMPGMTGSELLSRARREHPDAARVLITGYSDLPALVSAVNEGGIYFHLAKPWGKAELDTVLGGAAEHARVLRENRKLVAQLETANAELEERVAARTFELEEANARIAELARTDSLTGLPNRRAFDEALVREVARAHRSGTALVLAFADLDHFKRVNDDFGHPVGDALLAAVGGTLRSLLRLYDHAARYGGEELALLLPETSLEQGGEVAERMRATIAALEVPGCARSVTLSVGLAALEPGEAEASLLRRADAAVYQAKHAGRNRVVRAEKASR